MKFSIEQGIATVKVRSTRKSYSSSVRKFEPKSINVVLMEIDYIDDPAQGKDVDTIDASKRKWLKKPPSLKNWTLA